MLDQPHASRRRYPSAPNPPTSWTPGSPTPTVRTHHRRPADGRRRTLCGTRRATLRLVRHAHARPARPLADPGPRARADLRRAVPRLPVHRARGGRARTCSPACAGGSGRSPATTRGSTGPRRSPAWDEPGTVRVLFAHWVETDATDGAELVTEARVQPTDRTRRAAPARAVEGDRPVRAARRRRGAQRRGRARLALALDLCVHDGDAEAVLERLVLAVVEVRMREHDDAVGREGRERVLGSRRRARSRRCRRQRRCPPLRGARRSPPERPPPRRSRRRSRRPRTPPWTGWWRARSTSTSAPSHLVAERGAQQVRVDGLGRDDKQLHIAVATPRAGASNGAAGRPARTHDDRDVVARPGRRWTSSASRSTASAIAAASAPAQPASTCASRSGPARRRSASVTPSVNRTSASPGHELDAALRSAPARRRCPAGCPASRRCSIVAVRPQHERQRMAGGDQARRSRRPRAGSATRTPPCRSGSRGGRAAAPR